MCGEKTNDVNSLQTISVKIRSLACWNMSIWLEWLPPTHGRCYLSWIITVHCQKLMNHGSLQQYIHTYRHEQKHVIRLKFWLCTQMHCRFFKWSTATKSPGSLITSCTIMLLLVLQHEQTLTYVEKKEEKKRLTFFLDCRVNVPSENLKSQKINTDIYSAI